MNQKTNASTGSIAEQKALIEKAIEGMSRETLTHLIDEAEGVGCMDEVDEAGLRAQVMRLWTQGKIPSADICDLA
ncbi:hypothetical protein [Burkholderia sp. Ac-20365]|uniref:hypothetical protein n=1 Tax=Burkholderia sp. Ac-20365 TaxID=2703897 RepID=UPI00197C3DED|nr:hypothetical protein [Burkholderia sp. Ac-20365]MBN3761254.1 hypothetical protein [Burkholderia sp. Ac-20365]